VLDNINHMSYNGYSEKTIESIYYVSA
jgi:hypothetical protein